MVRFFSYLIPLVSVFCIIACGGGSSGGASNPGDPAPISEQYYYNVNGVSDFSFSEPYITSHIFSGVDNLFERFDLATEVTYNKSDDQRVQYYFLDFYIISSDTITESDFDKGQYIGDGEEIAFLAFNPTNYDINLNISYDYNENKLYAVANYLGIDYRTEFNLTDTYGSDLFLLTVGRTQIVELNGSFTNYIDWKVINLPFDLY